MKEFRIENIDPQQRIKALKILTAVDLFIEQQQLTALNLTDFDDEWQQDNYRVEVKKKPLGNLIVVSSTEGLEIKFLSNTLIEAHGINERDCEYWSQIYSCDENLPLIEENPL